MNKTLNFWMLPCAPCMVYLPTYATKSPSFVGKYTSAMEHMGLIYLALYCFGGFSVIFSIGQQKGPDHAMSSHDDSAPVFDDGHDVRFRIQWEETCIETRCLESGIS